MRPVDYGMAEALAFGTLLLAGTPVRLSGQDTRRGTFNQRHAALIDIQSEFEYVPLSISPPGKLGVIFATRRFPKPACWASNMAIAAITLRRLCCGRRSSAISRTARR